MPKQRTATTEYVPTETGTLVETLEGPGIESDLKEVFEILANDLLTQRSGCAHNVPQTLQQLDQAVRKTEASIDLRKARSKCTLIKKDEERPTEIYNNLGHIYVLLKAAEILRSKKMEPETCAPTQQSFDDNHSRIPDLLGAGWALEAFGGLNIRNNGKLAKELKSLSNYQEKTTFIACRREAWIGKMNIRERCGRSQGGPFKTEACARLFGEIDNVVVFEISDIKIT